MSRNKEGLVLLLDVGPSMHNHLPEVQKMCSMLIQKKLIYGRSDEVGVVIFGTPDTANELTTEVGGYENIVVLQNIKVVDGDLIESLQQLPRGTVSGDYLDAIVVGMDLLIKKYQSTNKGKKRLCLITNALCPIKDPYEGSKADQVSTIASQMMAHGMRMESIIVRGRLSEDADQRILEENDHLLNLFSEKTSAKAVYVESPTSLLGALRTRNISPVTIFRGDLDVSPKLKIKVWVYKKTTEEKFPTLKKYSDKAPPTDRFATHEVKVDYEYKSVEDRSKVVPPEQRIKGYRYGPHVVPISSAEWDTVKFKPEKSVKLLGFTDASNIMRHYFMKDVNIFIAEPGNVRATLAVSALARAMKEMDKVAILRCVWRQGQGNVVVGVLTPNISEKDNTPDSFYFNVLPFAEDVREFQFPSFSNFPASWQPNEQQQEAADNLVKMLDLAPSGKQEALLPEFMPNPILERFYCYLELKSKHPDAAVPPLDETLKKITEPDPELLSENKSVIDIFCRSFELKENPKLKKSTRRLLHDKPSGSDEERDFGDASNALFVKSAEHKPVIKVEKIGASNPVRDFEAMMLRRDSPEWIGKAINEMEQKINDLVRGSYEGNNFPKALECLLALRKGCTLEQMRGGSSSSSRRTIELDRRDVLLDPLPEVDNQMPFESDSMIEANSEFLQQEGTTVVPSMQFSEEPTAQTKGDADHSSSRTHVPRGPSCGLPTPADVVDRTPLRVSAGSFIGSLPSSTISATLKQFFSEPWTSWKKVPVQTRGLLWGHFKGKFQWDQLDSTIRRVWDQTCAARHRDILCEARRSAKRLSGTVNVADWRDVGPVWMSQDIWQRLLDIWATEDWQHISATASRNRQSERGSSISKHSAGSVSFSTHRERLSVALGRPATHLEVFELTHRKKGAQGVWIDSRSKAVYESYTQTVSQRHGEDHTTQSEFDSTAWVRATGKPTRNRLYGFSPNLSRDEALKGFSASSLHSIPEVEKLRRRDQFEIADLRAQIARHEETQQVMVKQLEEQRMMMEQLIASISSRRDSDTTDRRIDS